MATNMATEPENVVNLKGTAANPARDPRRRLGAGDPGSIGDTALKDGICIVVAAWIVLLVLAWSLRHHNV